MIDKPPSGTLHGLELLKYTIWRLTPGCGVCCVSEPPVAIDATTTAAPATTRTLFGHGSGVGDWLSHAGMPSFRGASRRMSILS